MQQVIIKTAAFLLTFLLGLSFSSGNFLLTTPPELNDPTIPGFESVPIETSVCKIEDYSHDFNGKLVSFRATTYAFDSELVLFPLGCTMEGDGSNYFLDPSIKLNNFSGANADLITILQSQKPRSNHPNYKEIKEVDIKVVGIVKEFYDHDGYKRYSIIPKKIEIISPFRQFEPRGAA
jgi:hypothetical protein